MAPKTPIGKGKRPAKTSTASSTALPPFTVEHPSTPIPCQGTFGANHAQNDASDVHCPSLRDVPVFGDRTEEAIKLLSEPSTPTFRRLVTDAPLESVDRTPIEKPLFLFGDHSEDPDLLELGSYRWLRTVGQRSMFLPAMERDYSLADMRTASTPRKMNWDLTPSQDGVTCGHFSRDGAQIDRHGRYITGLHPGLFQKDFPVGEAAVAADTFGRTFHTSERQFPAKDFRTPGWSRWGSAQWWPRITNYILKEYSEDLHKYGLYAPIRATQFGLRTNAHQFFSILELYNPVTRTFFVPDGELGIALHEMAEVSGLPYGRYPYEEYIPGQKELANLEKSHPQVVETYWELMCHYYTCVCSQGRKDKKGEKTISHSTWAHYLFSGLNDKNDIVLPLGPMEAGPLSQLVLNNLPLSYVPCTDEHGFPAGMSFDTYLYQAGEPISSKAVLAGYLMLWLKHIVVPCGTFEVLSPDMIFTAVCMAHGRQYALLPAMLARLHCGLRSLCLAFNQGFENPRVELPYTYLMAWFVMHCPTLMSAPSAQVEGQITPFVQRLENAEWSKQYMAAVRRTLRDYKSYSFNRCFPSFSGVNYGQAFTDESDTQGYTTLSLGCFLWLMTIRPGYFVFRVGPVCVVEPYLPCRFARQFGYDQLYIGNPNTQLESEGCGLIIGARAWFWSVAGGTGARFSLPQRDTQPRTTFAYCKWHCIANAEIPGFNINSSGLRLIRRRYREGQTSTRSRIPGLKEFLNAEKDVGAETPSPSSPHETQAEIDEALSGSMFPSPSGLNEYGSNIPSAAGVRGATEATPVPMVPEEPTPTSQSAARGSKRPGPPKTKRVAKRLRQGPLAGVDTKVSSDDDISLSQLHLRQPPAPETSGDGTARGLEGTVSAFEGTTISPIITAQTVTAEPASPPRPATPGTPPVSTAADPPMTTAIVVYTGATSTAAASADQPSSTAASSADRPRPMSPPASPTSPFDKSRAYGVTLIRNNFLTILKGSHTQVLEHGGDFAGIKSVLEPLLDVMQSLTSATATLPYRTYLVQAETLFNRWQRQRDHSPYPLIRDRAMELMRIRDDTQFELQRQILEKKQAIGKLGEKSVALHQEKKKIAETQHSQKRLVDSYKAALLDLQAKLAKAEDDLRIATERYQALEDQWTEHQAAIQAESDDLEGLSVAVSGMPVLSDDDLYRQATEEIKAAHKETMAKIATEIRQTLENL